MAALALGDASMNAGPAGQMFPLVANVRFLASLSFRDCLPSIGSIPHTAAAMAHQPDADFIALQEALASEYAEFRPARP